jgi:hypothetical protein
MSCLAPAREHPVGWIVGAAPPGWEPLARQGDLTLARAPAQDCSSCPLRGWPASLPLLGVDIDEGGLTARILFQEAGGLAAAIAKLAEAGHDAAVVACSPRVPDPEAVPRLLDLSGLAPRQRQALASAARLGYFASGSRASTRVLADAMGCSPATANEHLRKGLHRVVGAWATSEGLA